MGMEREQFLKLGILTIPNELYDRYVDMVEEDHDTLEIKELSLKLMESVRRILSNMSEEFSEDIEIPAQFHNWASCYVKYVYDAEIINLFKEVKENSSGIQEELIAEGVPQRMIESFVDHPICIDPSCETCGHMADENIYNVVLNWDQETLTKIVTRPVPFSLDKEDIDYDEEMDIKFNEEIELKKQQEKILH